MAQTPESGTPAPDPVVREIRQWLEQDRPRDRPILASSNQGQIIAWPDEGGDWVVKLAHGKGLLLRMRQSALGREYRAYRRLQGVPGFPHCAGLVNNQALVLEHVKGKSIRDSDIPDRQPFFDALLESIKAMHARGVAHGDLKRKSNLLVNRKGRPVIVDLGASLIRKPGRFHPINHRLFRLLCQTDLNAWVKHKHNGYRNIPEADRQYLRRTPVERVLQAWRR